MSGPPNNEYEDYYSNCPKVKKPKTSEEFEHAQYDCVNAKIFDEIKSIFEARYSEIQENIRSKNSKILEALTEQRVILEELIQKEVSGALNHMFPIRTEEDLETIDHKITKINRQEYISTIAGFLRHGVGKHFPSILGYDIILSFNFDGTHGKKRLKDYKSFCDVVLDAIRSLMPANNPEEELRKAIAAMKKRHYKRITAKRATKE